uniref:Uncharacterized protein n=1 Tax=Plectus sambesii TaxID=2011161 RepID=A0A914VU59_9BILA
MSVVVLSGGLSAAARREPISDRVGRPQVTHVVAAHQRLRARVEQVIERAVDADRLLGGDGGIGPFNARPRRRFRHDTCACGPSASWEPSRQPRADLVASRPDYDPPAVGRPRCATSRPADRL